MSVTGSGAGPFSGSRSVCLRSALIAASNSPNVSWATFSSVTPPPVTFASGSSPRLVASVSISSATLLTPTSIDAVPCITNFVTSEVVIGTGTFIGVTSC